MSEVKQFSYEVAVVGLSGRFPGARNVEEFWQRLCEGAELVTFLSNDDPRYVRAEAILEDVELFDAAFFGFTPREAEILDPQHRLFLEESWAALENAGYNPETYQGRAGVFAGESLNAYFLHNIYPNRQLLESLGSSQVVIANDRDYLSTQVSFRLNLKGPSLTVQTACSTSLVAVHLACQSLLNHECDLALAGGVSISVPQGLGGHYQEGGIISPDGHCRAFDAKARGTVKGSGLGVVVLKRLADALSDRDTIHAVIKGSAINNDGSMKVGFTAPGVEGQASVIEEALALASVEPETIGYVETHGTGTPLGDPAEIAALTQAFRTGTDATNFCRIGSVKTNIGHLDAAAGVAGLIKTILSLEQGKIPPSLHFDQPNPNIDFAGSPFAVNTNLRRWETNGAPRRAGVSSFGIGGTNAHVVLEEAPRVSPSESPQRSHQLLVLSARTPNALGQATANMAMHLKRHPELNLADVAFTLSVGRKEFEHRLALVCQDTEEAATKLSELVHCVEPLRPELEVGPPEEPDSEVEFLQRVRRLWLSGVEIDWSGFYAGQQRRRVALPTYPFERRRYWIDPPSFAVEQTEAVALAGPRIKDDAETLSTRTEVEAAVLKIWRELFGLDNIGPDDDFFDLGGNSLLALQLVAQLRTTFKLDLPLRVVFESQKATVLAARIFDLRAREQEAAEIESLLREIESSEESPAPLQPAKDLATDRPAAKSVSFSLYFFSDDGTKASDDKYRLVLESAKFADRHGFSAVWTPERHFQDFGGLYPNPSVLSAALAVLTERIQIRAGSVALPLHHPVRVAEEWSIVDNLSRGRVAVSFASGWHANDFIFAPELYDDRKEVMFRHIELVQKLWAGGKVKLPSAGGAEVEIQILPRPLQQKLPIWITSSGSVETWRRAGEIGANVLAAYVGYSQDELAQRIEVYREARAAHGHDPLNGVVTIMLHTFIGEDDETVKEKVRMPFSNYLGTYFKQYENGAAGVQGVTDADRQALMDAAFEKYFDSSTLMGAPDKCARLIDALADIGVDEIACLVDFGVDVESVLESLSRLDELKGRYER